MGETNRAELLAIIPGKSTGFTMHFAIRQTELAQQLGYSVCRLYLGEHRFLPLVSVILQLIAMARKGRFFGVHAHYGSYTGFIGACISFFGGTPLMVSFRGSDLQPSRQSSRWKRPVQILLSRIAFERASILLPVSSDLLRWRIRADQRSWVVPSSVNFDLFEPKSKYECRAKLGLNQYTKYVLLNLSGNEKGKGLDLGALALEDLRRKGLDCELMLLRGKVPHSQMPLYLNAADCVLMLSEKEGSPNIVKEALACNTPVVSVDVGDVLTYLSVIPGCSVVEREVQLVSNAIAKVVQSDQKISSRDLVMKIFSEESVKSKLEEAYRNCINLSSQQNQKNG